MDYIKKIIPVKVKRYLKASEYIKKMKKKKLMKEEFILFRNSLEKSINKPKIFILDACDHRNLGDQAILMAEQQFIKDNFQECELICVGMSKFNHHIETVLEYVTRDDIIVLHGGGNLGDEYKNAEIMRRRIIQLFPKNKIVLFPQTMYFRNNKEGDLELSKSKAIYSNHQQLSLVAREKVSFEKMKEHFKHNKIILTPDIVLYLNKSNPKGIREGAVLCIRDDKEGLLVKSDKEQITDLLKCNFSKVTITDTIGESSFSGVEQKFNEFKNAQIVITDRLHGMVFAAITGTPCIALSNYNYKVSGTYEWLKHLEYIKFTNKISEIPKLLSELKLITDTNYVNDDFTMHYKQIIDIMTQKIKC
ncbi:polysaccharide pyruvyl transferase family protein [Metabacillus halosaccharovorans]|uniref:polysaccharide pyruvyl transferase family protein n=1 Tax=Metabacillus halosaccharovorans TaxID=930124 RepID=UPI0034D00C28